MVRIRHVKINGLYSYGSEKNQIDFGQRTVVVGTNDSGKSSILKALNFFLKCLKEHGYSGSNPPWDRQGTHEMTVGLSLNDEERRYTAEILSVIDVDDGRQVSLGRDAVMEWLASRLGRVELTARWRYDLPSAPDRIEYSLSLEELGAAVCSSWDGQDPHLFESPRFPARRVSNAALFHDVVLSMLKDGSAAEGLGGRLGEGAKIPNLPEIRRLEEAEPPARHRSRLELVDRMSGGGPKRDTRSFFVTFGRMLERGFAFVSERRRFQGSNDLERLPLASDGSNLQSCLFWLQNGDRDEQDAFSAIRDMFEDVMEQQNLSFVVSVKEKVSRTKRRRATATARGILAKRKKVSQASPAHRMEESVSDRAVVQFVRKNGREQGLLDFASVGIGIRETLFLLAACFVRRDKVILLGEPAAGLHPTQIRRLMEKIMSAGDQGAESGQVVVVTHSPTTLASLGMLSVANEIVRVSRRGNSRIAQPSGKHREWVGENLPAFHLRRSDVFFADGVVLVEGYPDRIILEAVLDRGLVRGGDIAVVNAEGSFEKFRRLLGIFEIPYAILVGDAGGEFDPGEVVRIGARIVPAAGDVADKTVCLLERGLEGFLSDLEPELFAGLEEKYETKTERARRFAERLLAGEISDKNVRPLGLLMEQIAKNPGSARHHGDPSSNPRSIPAEGANGAA